MFRNLTLRLKSWARNTNGSETIELIYAVASLSAILIMAMLIFSYALQVNQVSYAAKRLTREIEVTGKYNHEEQVEMLKKLLGNFDDIDPTIQCSLTGDHSGSDSINSYAGSTGTTYIQMRDKFNVIIDAKYKVPVFAMGKGENVVHLSVPIHVYTDGQSEIWWRETISGSGVSGSLLTPDD